MTKAPETASSELTTQDVVEMFGSEPEKVLKLLLLGNSGTGKSFLCNAIAGEDVFKHEYGAKSCTAENSFFCVEDAAPIVLCNVPGLIEAQEQNIPRNEREIKRVYEKVLPGAPTGVIFILSHTNGRVRSEDLEAVHCVQRYCPMNPASVGYIVNCLDWDELRDDPEKYQIEATAVIRENCRHPDAKVEFIGKIPKPVRNNYKSDVMKELQGRLVAFSRLLAPLPMIPEPNAELILDKARLQKEIDAMNAKILEQEAQFERIRKEDAAKWEGMIKQLRDENAAREASLKREISALQSRPPQVIRRGHGGCRRGGGGCLVS